MKTIVPYVIAVVCLCAYPISLRAEMPATSQQHLNESFQRIDELARIRRASGSLPRSSNAEDSRALEAFWDKDAILGNGPYRSADIPALLDILQKESAVFKTYLLFSPDQSKLPQTDENTAVFQDELSRSLAFTLGVSAAALDALTDFVAQMRPGEFNDTRKQGLQQTRLGIQQFVDGAVLMIRSPALRSENRSILANALQKNAATLAATMPAAERQALAAMAMTVTAPETREALGAFVAAMQTKDCTGLCAIE